MEKKESKVLPLLALLFGIASIVLSCVLFISLPLAVTSIVLAIISFVKKKPVAMPIVGLICSFGGIIATIIISIVSATIGTSITAIIGAAMNDSIVDSAEEASKEIIEAIEKEDEIFNKLENYNVITNVEQNTTNTIETNNIEVSTTDVNAEISDDWKNGEFIFDGKKYKLFDQYSNFELAGWTFDMKDYGYDDSYVLNSNQKTFSTIYLENDNHDARVSIGLINNNSTVSTIKQCAIWSFDVANSFAKNPVEFTLAKGIKNGSTLADVKVAYGEPDDTYYSESLKYWVYTYDNELKPKLRLTIYEDISKGLTEFEYSHY